MKIAIITKENNMPEKIENLKKAILRMFESPGISNALIQAEPSP